MASDSFLNLCNPWSIRDIPMPLVSSGVEHGNLRELALARMKDMGTEVRLTALLMYRTVQKCWLPSKPEP